MIIHQKRHHLLDKHLHLIRNSYDTDPRKTFVYWRLSADRQWHQWIVPSWRNVIWSVAVAIYLLSIFVETVKHGFLFSMGLILSGVALYWIDVVLFSPGIAWLASGNPKNGSKIDSKTFQLLLTTMVFGGGAYWAIIKAVLR
jgi:hypothetical protein